jgi:hypothetical protein
MKQANPNFQTDWDAMGNEGIRQLGLKVLSEQWERGGYNLIPLVTKEMFLRCSVDILLLRPEEPRYVMNSGDLDAKVKNDF